MNKSISHAQKENVHLFVCPFFIEMYEDLLQTNFNTVIKKNNHSSRRNNFIKVEC